MMTLQDVGRLLGMTHQAAHLIERRALAKLRQRLEAKGWKAEDVRELLDARESVATAWRDCE